MTTMQIALKRSNPNALSVRLAGKLLLVIVFLTLFMAVLLSSLNKAFAGAFPRADIMIKGEQIKLGDVFDGLTQHADFALAPAPGPGEELVWNAPTLLRIATAFNLPWRPQDADQVRIRRAAVKVDGDTLRAVVRDHLASVAEQDVYDVRFTGNIDEMIVSTQSAPRFEMVDFNMQPLGGTFSAIVRVMGDDGKPQNVNLRGVAERMTRVPVLKRAVLNGDIIKENDITWTTEKSLNLRKDAVLDPALIVGATPRRVMGAGEIVRADSLVMPQLIKRGDIVTMVFREGGMYLTARGRAVDDGSMNQIVKVLNTGSKRQVEARVTGHKEVTVN